MAILHLDLQKHVPAIMLPGRLAPALPLAGLLGVAACVAVVLLPEGSAGLLFRAMVVGMLSATLFGIWRGKAESRTSAKDVDLDGHIRARTSELRAAMLSLEKEVVERRLAEERAAEGKRRLDELIMRTGTATVLIDGDMRVVECNHALAGLLGRGSARELVGRDLARLLGLKDSRRLRRFRDEALRLGSFGCELEAAPPARGGVSIEANGVSTVIDGRPCVMALFRDVSERSAAARELMQGREALATALDVARRANESKSVFLAKLNHELRTRLNGIIGLSEVLRHKAAGGIVRAAEVRQLGDNIHQSGEHVLSLLEDLVDLSRLDTGSRALDPKELSVRNEIDSAVAALAPAAARKRIRIENACATHVAWMLDRRSFRQVVINLVGNAVKFSPADSHVRIAVACSADALALQVTDEGPGIGDEERARILAPFGRGRDAEANGIEGLGLGLAIVSELLALQGGSLEIDSEPGGGATFTAIFPLGTGQSPMLQIAAE